MAAPTLAKPAKTEAPKSAEERRLAKIVLASADPARSSAVTEVRPTSAAVKRPAPRITTCRCGDQQVEPQTQEQ